MEDVRTRRGVEVVVTIKLKLKKNWTTGQTALQRFNTAFLRDTDRLIEFKIALNNRFQASQDLVKEEKYVEELATMAEKAAREGDMKRLYDTTKKLKGKYGKPERPVKAKECKPITEIQQQRNRWVEYFL
ncbi:unnamed protein product [Schistosoma margrebowiei]|uniref:Uncharacterized protein n=1 Tax=Schistosoma margrebowiei TaxID=48269 RepID=A0A183LVB0_9TREM|nr:unnamed protein product [Schistosoma margrebowiei]